MKCSKGNERFSILRNSLLSTFQKSQQIKRLWIWIPIWKRKILMLILNSVSGDDKSCVKFTPPLGENVAINLGSNGFPIVNSLAPISTNDKLYSSPNSSDLTWIPFSGYELEGDPGVPPRGSHLRARHKNHSQVSLAIMMMLDDDGARHKNHSMPVVRLAMMIVKVCVVLNRVLRYRRWMWILRVKWISQELFEFSPPKKNWRQWWLLMMTITRFCNEMDHRIRNLEDIQTIPWFKVITPSPSSSSSSPLLSTSCLIIRGHLSPLPNFSRVLTGRT